MPATSPVPSKAHLSPGHGEAYPGFAIKSADAHWQAGETSCEWEDRHGELVGQLEMQAWDGPSFRFLYSVGSRTYRDQRALDLRIARVRLPSGRYEARAFCPVCNRIKDRLFHRWRRWACQQCQELVQRRSLLSELDRLILHREQLIRQVYGPGTATRSALATARSREELRRLNERFDQAGIVPQLAYPISCMVAARWFGRDEPTRADDEVDAPAYLGEERPAGRATGGPPMLNASLGR